MAEKERKPRAKPKRSLKPEVKQFAEQLREKDIKPLAQIDKIVRICGLEFTRVMVENTLTIEEHGGMMTADGARRRTVGGVFFFMVRHSLPEDLRDKVFPQPKWAKPKPMPKSKYPPFDWESRTEELAEALTKEIGKVEEVNISLKGRPGHVEKRAGVYIATLDTAIPDNQTFPRGLPDPPDNATRYYLYISEQQWKKHVKGALEKDENAQLAVEGGCCYDDELEGVAIYVRAIKVQKPKPKPDSKPEDEQQGKTSKDDEHAPRAEAINENTVPSIAPPKPTDDEPDLSGFPDDVAKKLRPLYGARKLFRKRLKDIEAMPPDKQSGLQAAKMMLERTEKQIEALESQAEKTED